MGEAGQEGRGLLASARRLLRYILLSAHNRLELFFLEIQEEERFAISALFWLMVGVLFGLLALIAITVAVVLLAPENVRPLVLAGFGVAYLVVAMVSLLRVRKMVTSRPPLFSTMVSELKKDISMFKG